MTRHLLALPILAALSLSLPAAAQVKPVKGCDPRIDVNSLPRNGASRHYINAPGSYVLTNNIRCGAGETAIEIGPGATSVTLDGNGFLIFGNPASSVSGIVCAPSPSMRHNFQLGALAIEDFIGDGIVIRDFDQVGLHDVLVAHVAGTGVSVGGGGGGGGGAGGSVIDVDADQVTTKHCAVGHHYKTVTMTCRRGVVSGCGMGMLIESPVAQLSEMSIGSIAGDGLVFDDLGGSFAVGRGGWDLKENTKIYECGDDGVEARISGPTGFSIGFDDTCISHCGDDGFVVDRSGPTLGSCTVTLDSTKLENNGGSGLHGIWGGASWYTLDSIVCTGSSSSGNGRHGLEIDGHVPIVRGSALGCDGNAQDGVHIAWPPSSPGSEPQASFSGLSSSNNGQDGIDVSNLPGTRGVCSLRGFDLGGNGGTGISAIKIRFRGWDGLIYHRSAGGSGVVAQDSELTLSEVSISNTGSHGIQLSSSDLDADGLTISGAGGDGISAVSSDFTVRRGSISASNFRGVHATAGSSFKGWDGTVKNSGQHGILADESSVRLTHWNIGSSGQDGVSVFRAELTLEDCNIGSSGQDGVRHVVPINDAPIRCRIARCVIEDNGGMGLRLKDKSSVKLLETCVRGNAAAGLSHTPTGPCAPTTVEILDSSFAFNGGTGIEVRSSGSHRIERSSVVSSGTGIALGDTSGSCATSGAVVTQCFVSECGTGISVEANSKAMITNNRVCTCPLGHYVVGTGNLMGPVITSTVDLGLSSNPHANYAQ